MDTTQNIRPKWEGLIRKTCLRTQDMPAPVLAAPRPGWHVPRGALGLTDGYGRRLDLILGLDDLRLLYVHGRVNLRSGPAQLQMTTSCPQGPASHRAHCGLSATGSFAGSSARSSGSALSRLSRPPPLRPRRRRHFARRDGPARSTPITPTLLPSKARNGRRLVLGGGLASRRSLTVPPASSMAWRCSRTARSSTWHPLGWLTRNCALWAPTTLRSRRSGSNTLTC